MIFVHQYAFGALFSTRRVYNQRPIFCSLLSLAEDLGWCVDLDVDLADAFYDTQCESTWCGVTYGNPCAPP